MAKFRIPKGSTDQTIDIFIPDSSSTTGEGKTGLAFGTSGLKLYYRKGATATATQLTLVTQTVGGAHTDGGFVEIDATNYPGMYRLDLSDTIVDSPIPYVTLMISGSTDVPPSPIEIQVTDNEFTATEIEQIRHRLNIDGTQTAPTAGGAAKMAGTDAVLTLSQLKIVSTVTNEAAIDVTGNGTGDGLKATGGASGSGVFIEGGATTGHGMEIKSSTGSGSVGLKIQSVASGSGGDGIQSVGNLAGMGVSFIGGGTAGNGIFAQGGTNGGAGIKALGGFSDGNGVEFTARAGDKSGLVITGDGSGNGIETTGGATGSGMKIVGGATSGDGINITATDGHGLSVTGGGSNGAGIDAIGAGGGEGISAQGGATGNGIRAIGGATIGAAIRLFTTSGDGIDGTSVSGDQWPALIDDNWDEVLTGATHNVNNSSGKQLRVLGGAIFTDGTAQSGGNNTIQLASGDVTINGQFAKAKVLITGGTGVGQENIITDSVASTDTLTLATTWITNPDATSDYNIIPGQNYTTIRNGGYDNARVYVDTVNGTAGTQKGVSGTTTNPVDNLIDAYVILAQENFHTIEMMPNSSGTLPSDSSFLSFVGAKYDILLNGQNIEGSTFNGADSITGIGTGGALSRQPFFSLCALGSVTLPPSGGFQCAFFGTFTFSSAGQYTFGGSATILGATSIFDFGSGLNSSTLSLPSWGGGEVEIQNAGAGTGTYLLDLNGDASLTINANCSATTTVTTRGNIGITNNASGITINDTSNITQTQEDIAGVITQGDAAWTTGAGGSPPDLLQTTTIATLASQTSFTLTAGSADNDAYNGAMVVVTDAVTAVQKAVGVVSDYVGSSLTVTLDANPGIFTMAVGDTISLIAKLAAGSGTGDWTTTEKNQLRHRLNIDGTQAAPTSGGSSQLAGSNATLNLQAISVSNVSGDAVKFESTGANGAGLNAIGHNTGTGIIAQGGGLGTGVEALGGASSGQGMLINSSANDRALLINTSGSNSAMLVRNTSTTGAGLEIIGGSVSGDSIRLTAGGKGVDGSGVGGDQWPELVTDVGAGGSDWTTTEKNQLRHRLNIDGTQAAPTSGGSGQVAGSNAVLTLNQLKIISTVTNESAIDATGNGTGHGLSTTGGANGHGINAQGGANGDGMQARSGTGTGRNGFFAFSVATGNGGDGIRAIGTGNRMGIHAAGGPTAGHGIEALGGTNGGAGINATGGFTDGNGVEFTARGGNKAGLVITGDNSGAAIDLNGSDGVNGSSLTGSQWPELATEVRSSYKKNVAVSNFSFFMVKSSDNKTGETGLTIASTISKDAGTFGTTSNLAVEISAGWYRIDLTQAEMNGDEIRLEFTGGATANNREMSFKTNP